MRNILKKVSGKLPPRKLLPRKLPTRKSSPRKLPPVKILPYDSSTLWKLPPRKFPPMKITPLEIPSRLTNHANERKNKIAKFFALNKAVQHNILIKITKVLFDTQMISQKILGLDTFFTEWKKSKNQTKAKIAKWHLLAIYYLLVLYLCENVFDTILLLSVELEYKTKAT